MVDSQPLDHQGSPPLQLLIELLKNIYIKLSKTKDLALEGHTVQLEGKWIN